MVFQRQQPLLRRDLDKERQYPAEDLAHGDGVRSYVIVPLIARGTSIGTLAVASTIAQPVRRGGYRLSPGGGEPDRAGGGEHEGLRGDHGAQRQDRGRGGARAHPPRDQQRDHLQPDAGGPLPQGLRGAAARHQLRPGRAGPARGRGRCDPARRVRGPVPLGVLHRGPDIRPQGQPLRSGDHPSASAAAPRSPGRGAVRLRAARGAGGHPIHLHGAAGRSRAQHRRDEPGEQDD